MDGLERRLVCIVCPKGCRLRARREEGRWTVEGNGCPRGEAYALQELTAPTRVLTTTVRLTGGAHPRLPVKTVGAIPKERLFDAMEVLRQVELTVPVRRGDVVVPDLLGTGIAVVATQDAE